MLKQKNLFIPATVIALMLLAGCSSDENAKNTTSAEEIATLLGTDSNNNGVRDDVEKKIYEKYEKPLHQALLMEEAKFYQETMLRPVSEAKETVKLSIRTGNCQLYLMDIDKDIESDNWRETQEYIKNVAINNPQRVRKYLDYNLALSGGSYGSSPSDWNRDACSDEVVKSLEAMGL